VLRLVGNIERDGEITVVASEAFPLVKTGGWPMWRQPARSVAAKRYGCAPVAAGLCRPLSRLDAPVDAIDELELAGTAYGFWNAACRDTVAHLVAGAPDILERTGNPYHDDAGAPWPDNADRFMLLSRAAGTSAPPIPRLTGG